MERSAHSAKFVIAVAIPPEYDSVLAETCARQHIEHIAVTAESFGTLSQHSGAACVVTTVSNHESSIAQLAAIRKSLSPAPMLALAINGTAELGYRLHHLGVTRVVDLPGDPQDIALSIINLFATKAMSTPTGEIVIGQNQIMTRLLAELEQAIIAGRDLPILLEGETGTGKSHLAEWIHHRAHLGAPFIEVDCGALSGELMKSELFGHEKGAFTDAKARRIGKFEQAARGTIFLDEIGDLDLDLQRILLRVLQSGRFERLGGTDTLTSQAWIVAATNKNLRELVRRREFREDLFYRLNVLNFTVPTLRDRPEDILLLARFFIDDFCCRRHRRMPNCSSGFFDALLIHTWPGNIRELMHVIEKCLVLRAGDLDERSLEEILPVQSPQTQVESDLHPTNEYQRYYDAITRTGGNNHASARALGVTVQTVRSALTRYPGLAEHRDRVRS